MRISQKLDHTLRALTLLASRPQGEIVAAGDLADRLRLPRRFLEQQFSALARAGIVNCRRGAAGGCLLGRSAKDIAVRDIVLALEGDILDIPRQADSAVSELWSGIADLLEGRLGEISLAELALRQGELDAARQPMYYI
ncbi:MAG: RrF2 family transcriptional regulator [Coriobacteriia bacterium]